MTEPAVTSDTHTGAASGAPVQDAETSMPSSGATAAGAAHDAQAVTMTDASVTPDAKPWLSLTPMESYYLMAVLILVPCVMVLKRTGIPRMVAVVLAVPYFGFALFLTLVAFLPWTNVPPLRAPRPSSVTRSGTGDRT